MLIIDGLIFLALRKSTDLTALSFLICNVSSSQSYSCISVGVEKILVQVGVTTSRGGFLTRTDKTAGQSSSLARSFASSNNTNLLPGRKLVETLSRCCLTYPSHPSSTLIGNRISAVRSTASDTAVFANAFEGGRIS